MANDQLKSLTEILADDHKFTEMCHQNFQALDIDHDGNLNFEELKICMKQAAQSAGVTVPENVMKQCFDYFDKNSNNKIDEKEFKAFMIETFKNMKATLEK